MPFLYAKTPHFVCDKKKLFYHRAKKIRKPKSQRYKDGKSRLKCMNQIENRIGMDSMSYCERVKSLRFINTFVRCF